MYVDVYICVYEYMCISEICRYIAGYDACLLLSSAICVCVYVYIHMYVDIYIYMCVCVYVYMRNM